MCCLSGFGCSSFWCYWLVALRLESYSTSYIQSIIVISNSKGLSEILRDIRTSTYQICRIEEKINRTTKFNKNMCNWTFEVRDTLKILWKKEKLLLRSNFSFFYHNTFLHVVRFSCLGRDQIFTSR